VPTATSKNARHLEHRFHQLRQSDIDEELFDLVSGVELLRDSRT